MIGTQVGPWWSGPRARCGLLVAAMVLLAAVLLLGCSSSPSSAPRGQAVDSGTHADLAFTIPAGASKLGGQTTLLPSPLVMHVGQVIRIVNNDDVGYDLGTFYVGPRETMTQRAVSTGSYTSACTLHPSGRITLTIVK